MSDRVARLEAQVEELARAVEGLARRMAAVEGGRSEAVEHLPEPDRVESGAAPVAAVPIPAATEERWGPVALLGRTLMVLGGAYLFRALTEGGTVPPALGVALGLAYALLWLAFADRAAVRGRHLSASFHGAAFALIGAPLAWEAAARFQVLSAVQGAVLLTALAADATLAFMALGELLGERVAGRHAEVAALAALLAALFVLHVGSAAVRAARPGWRPRWSWGARTSSCRARSWPAGGRSWRWRRPSSRAAAEASPSGSTRGSTAWPRRG